MVLEHVDMTGFLAYAYGKSSWLPRFAKRDQGHGVHVPGAWRLACEPRPFLCTACCAHAKGLGHAFSCSTTLGIPETRLLEGLSIGLYTCLFRSTSTKYELPILAFVSWPVRLQGRQALRTTMPHTLGRYFEDNCQLSHASKQFVENSLLLYICAQHAQAHLSGYNGPALYKGAIKHQHTQSGTEILLH
jgi:hypothetical protein